MITTGTIIEFMFSFALFITAFLFIPQIIRILKAKTSRGISIVTFLGFLFIQLAIVLHWLISHDYLLVLGYLLSMMACGVISTYFGRNQQTMGLKKEVSAEDILAQLPGNVYWKNKEGVNLGCNANTLQYFSLKSLSEYIGKTDYDLVSKEIADKVRQVDKEIIKIGQLKIIEEENIIDDGNTTLYLSQKVPLKNKYNQIIGILGISFDITDTRKKEIDRLKLLENVIALTPGHVYWKDKNSVILGCNDQQAKTLGLSSRQDVIGKTVYDLIERNQPEEERRRQAAIIEENDRLVMEEGKIQTLEEPLILPDGSTAIYMSNKAPLYNSDGEIIGMVGVSVDVTEQRKKAEQELREVRHKLDGMTLVSASLAHELRTPLATISGGLNNLQKYLPDLLHAYLLAEQANLPVKKIRQRNFQLLEKLLTSLKSVARAAFTFIEILLMNVRPSMQPGASEVFHISKCVQDALARYPYQQDQKDLVHWNKKNDFLVKGNSLLVIHILFNLIKNALHYIAVAQKGEISIWFEKGDSHNRLYFKDTGEGIPKDILPHIFERFFTRTYHGAGIGLTFCKMVMESMEGTITCESEEKSYTQFMLSFPIVTE